MKNRLEEIDSRWIYTGKQISELKVRIVEITQSGQQKARISKNEGSIRDLWGNIKLSDICII